MAAAPVEALLPRHEVETIRVRLVAFTARTLVLLSVAALPAGCTPDRYPDSLTYPIRGDLLVLKADGENIAATFRPGELDRWLESIRTKAKDDPKYAYLDPLAVSQDKRDVIRTELDNRFGKPADPKVVVTDDPTFAKDMTMDPDTLARGSMLYRRHCLHCHGVSGDGHGPTAPWVNPPPRDYRQGKFKFASVSGGGKPLRSDLMRTLKEGIEGTSMPTFKAQPDRDLEALVSYVIHLAIRGETENYALEQVVKKSDDANNLPELIKERTNIYASQWKGAVPIVVAEMPSELLEGEGRLKSVERGYQLFIGKEAICISCHLDFGRQSKFRTDDWGTLVRPNNLTMGVYRGGRRPVDIYYRIHSGIMASKMPGANPAVLKDPKNVWDLVNFVQALPYPPMLPDSVRRKVYGTRD